MFGYSHLSSDLIGSLLGNFPQIPVFAQDGGGGLGPILPLIPIFIFLFYFMIIRPEQKKKAEMREMLNNLKKNDRVLTVGGILGTVMSVQKDSDEVTLKIDETTNAKLHVLRSSIARVITDKDKDLSNDRVGEKIGDKG